ncbi:MAG: hypothetical protein KY468_15630 [Armatimonadetes bacterium]|nr:hypothetical protein [Armatimonadota bacterium]
MAEKTLTRAQRIWINITLGVGALMILGTLAMWGMEYFTQRGMRAVASESIPRPAPPSPNAYEFYEDAAMALVDTEGISQAISTRRPVGPGDPPDTLEEKEAIVKKNARALQLLRKGFRHPYLAPPMNPAQDAIAEEFPLFAKFRSLARLLALEGRVKESRGDRAGAIQSYLDAVRLGQDLPRGGAFLVALMGYAAGAMGRYPAWSTIEHLNAEPARRAARRMEEISERHVPFLDTLIEEREWHRRMLREELANPERSDMAAETEELVEESDPARQQMPYGGVPSASYHGFRAVDAYVQAYRKNGLRPIFSEDASDYPRTWWIASSLLEIVAPVYDKGWVKERNDLTQNRLLATALALRAYRLERGEYPESLSALVPAYLTRVPNDPFAPKTPLRYRRTDGSYLLYSVGPDGKDDGGTPIINPKAKRNLDPRTQHHAEAGSKGDIVAGVNL